VPPAISRSGGSPWRCSAEAASHTVEVMADGKGLASHPGSALLVAVADKVGLTNALSEALAPTRRAPLGAHPGEVVRPTCARCSPTAATASPTSLGAPRDQEDLFGRVASDGPRVIGSLCDEGMLERLRAARARGPGARARA
jgi:hypothetical protein